MIDLKGKVVLVTGASRGIGAAAAIMFAEAGADVIVNYNRAKSEAARVVDQALSRGVRAAAFRADISRFDQVRDLFDHSLKEFGRLDVLVINAGIWKEKPIDQMTEPEWDEMLDVNLKSTYACCHFAAKVMKEQHGGGRIITVSSTAGQRGESLHSHYAASKGGMISMTKSLATELGPHGITVNSVAPGWVDTDMSADPLRIQDELKKIVGAIPLGRVATAADIAGPIVFLASDLARHITGEILNVNGGSVLCG